MPGSAAAVDVQRTVPGFANGFDRRQLADQLSSLFSDRASFELNDEDVVALRRSLHLSSRDSLTALRQSLEASRQDPILQGEFAAWQERHPCALKKFAKIAQHAHGKRLAVFLDYDGTLTPIVKNPDEAFMTDQMRDIVRQLAQLFPTAIISGRGREKLQNFVQLKEMFYAGSHGLDIVGPRDPSNPDEQFAFQPAARFEETMDTVYNTLTKRLKSIPGASVEHNKFCVSAHFRNCCPESWEGVLAAVTKTVAEHPELKFSKGRKVLEIKPQVEWDKGKALLHLLDALGLDDNTNVLPIYIGDDQTDEDAFRSLRLRSNGMGILVSSKAKPTAATYALRDPAAVAQFLSQLVAWGRTAANDWQACGGCNGWELDRSQLHNASSSSAPKAQAASNGADVSSSSAPSNGADASSSSAPEAQAASNGAAESSPSAAAQQHHDSSSSFERPAGQGWATEAAELATPSPSLQDPAHPRHLSRPPSGHASPQNHVSSSDDSVPRGRATSVASASSLEAANGNADRSHHDSQASARDDAAGDDGGSPLLSTFQPSPTEVKTAQEALRQDLHQDHEQHLQQHDGHHQQAKTSKPLDHDSSPNRSAGS